MKRTAAKEICYTGIGIALFVVLSMALQTPVFENYYLCLGYVAVAVYCCLFGPLQGAAVGILGVVAYSLLINGLRGMPGWALGNLFIGVTLGFAFRYTARLRRKWLANLLNLLAAAMATLIGILILKSLTEVILYAQPMAVRMAKNTAATVTDVVVLLVGVEVAEGLRRFLKAAWATAR